MAELGGLVGGTTLCALIRAQAQQPAPSLGLVKVRAGAQALVREGQVWTVDKELLAQISAQPNLFREEELQILQPPPFQVSYWHCWTASAEDMSTQRVTGKPVRLRGSS